VIHDAPDGAILDVKVIPRAGKTALAGTRDNALLIRLAAAPVGGAANDELISLLSGTLDLPKRHIVLLSGEKSRSKRVKVIGLSKALVRERLGLLR
jgi:uncharacterized protein (TIGR00251 family)